MLVDFYRLSVSEIWVILYVSLLKFFVGKIDRVMVFVEQKRQADFLASYLSQSEYPTTSIHG